MAIGSGAALARTVDSSLGVFAAKAARAGVDAVHGSPDPKTAKYVGWLRGLDRRASVEAARAVIDRVGLGRAADARMKTLSGGMLRRVALAQALVASPSLLLLDEPTTGLDPEQRRSIRGLIAEAGAGGRIVVLSSHIVEDVVSICDRVIALREGELVLDVPTSELLDHVARTDATAEETIVQILSGNSPLRHRDHPESA